MCDVVNAEIVAYSHADFSTFHYFSAPPPSTANQGGMAAQLANVKLKEAPEPETATDGRSGLLQAIRVGQLVLRCS